MSNDLRQPVTETVGTDFAALPDGQLFAGPLEQGSLLDGRYEIGRPLGRGGNATVYRAFDRHLGQRIALKVLHPHRLSESNRARFHREAQVARSLDHPNLLRVFDLGSEGPLLYLAMELVEGETLAERISAGAPLGQDEALALATPILEALAYLHDHKVLHRDIKPSNVLIADDGRVKLADLGLVLPLDLDEQRFTESQTVLGTLRYLSPEQARGEPATPVSDLYAFGLVLFEMLTGRLPHDAASSLGGVLERLSRAPTSLRSLRADIPSWLDAVVQRLLARDPTRRFGSAPEVAHHLCRRRAPLRPPRPLVAAIVGVAALTVGAAILWTSLSQPADLLLQSDTPEGGLRAVSSDGEVLWRRTNVRGKSSATILRSKGRPHLVAVTAGPTGEINEWKHDRFEFLAPDSGELRFEQPLPPPTPPFEGYADTFLGRPYAFDFDGDGEEELIVARFHTYAPCAISLVDPRLRRSTVLFESLGHHYPAGAVDLNDDGIRELILVGILNSLGWRTGIAAIDVSPWLKDLDSSRPPATSPESSSRLYSEPLWYWLAAPGRCGTLDNSQCLEHDAETRRLTFDLPVPVVLGFDGRPADQATLADSAREPQWRQAWQALREGRHLHFSESFAEAESSFRESRRVATLALSEQLARTAGILEAAMLALQGDAERAAVLLEQLQLPATERVDADFQIARALHLDDQLEEALRWYEKTVGPGILGKYGQNPHDYVYGWVLAAAELTRDSLAATRLMGDLERLPEVNTLNTPLEPLLSLRFGRLPAEIYWYTGPGSIDESRYLALEVRRARGEDPAGLLPEVDADLERASYTVGALRALRAELLNDLGDPRAAGVVRRAYAEASADRRRDLLSHFLFPVIEERLHRLAGSGSSVIADSTSSEPDGVP